MSQSSKKNTLSPSQFMPSQDNGKERTPKQRNSTRTNPPPFAGPSNVELLDAIKSLKTEFSARIDSLETTIADRVTEKINTTVQATVVKEVDRVCEPISQRVNQHQRLLEVVLSSQQRIEINACKLNAVVTGIPSDTSNEKVTELIESLDTVPQPVSEIQRTSRQGRKSSLLKFSDIESRNAFVKRFRDSGMKISDQAVRIAYETPPFQKRLNDLLFEKMRTLKSTHPGHSYRVDLRNKTIHCYDQPIMTQSTTGEIYPLSKDMDF